MKSTDSKLSLNRGQEDDRPSRFIVGIDLGTTNCAVAYLDTESENGNGILSFVIPQFVAPNVQESRRTLPSFFCQADFLTARLPWEQDSDKGKAASEKNRPGFRTVVGTMARDYGAEMPESYVSSAKSWLCHNGVDRTAAILPWTPDLEMEKQSGGNLSSEKKGENADRTNESAGMDYKSGLTETKSPKTFNEPVRRAKKWSPVEVSAAYLFHLRMAWNNSHPDYPLEKQDIVLTLPASFDEVARELTIEAAKLAGLPRITLIEEPQAAFYSWIDAHRENWSDLVLAGQKILVCDVGGGTTDLTLIRVLPVADKENSEESAGGPAVEGKPAVENKSTVEDKTAANKVTVDRSVSEETTVGKKVGGGKNKISGTGHNPEADTENGHSGKIRFHRVAVGDHLILGGDNFDLALAHYLESKLIQGGKFQVTDGKLAPRQWAALLRQSCQLKELFLSDSAPEIQTVSLPATGSRLIGGSKTFTVSRDEVRQVVLDGFFPKVPLESRPNRRRLGIREIGLPYASDPAISRHLARFLTVHRDAGLAAGHSVAEKLNSSVPDSESTTGETGGTVGGTAGATGTPNTVGSAVPEASPLQSSRPDLILFNGGVFASPEIQKRVLDLFVDWFHCPPPVVLQNTDLHLAVSRGAAYYGMVRRGLGERISASLARTYYVGVTDLRNSEAERKTGKISMDLPENPFNDSDSEGTVISDNDDFGGGINSETSEDSGLKMLCLIPARLEPDEEVVLADRTFSLTVDRPVSFPIFVSSTRLTDEPGEIVRLNPEETIPLPPIQTVLRTRNRAGQESGVVVELCGRLSQLGTIEMFLRKVRQEGDRGRLPSWKLQFDVRAATETDREKERTTGEEEGILDETLIESVQQTLRQVFVDTENSLKPSQLMRQLSAVTELPKNLFPTVLLRRISEMLLDMESGRKRSESHESRWLNLLGFALRPGFGVAMDDWRVDRVWKRNIGNLTYRTPGNRLQLWILWRRIAAGLSEGQQQMIIEPLLSNVRDLHRQLTENRGRGADLDLASQEGIEIWRLIGSLELIAPEVKEELGNLILDIVDKKRMKPATSAMFWTLGRLGSRVPFHAPINQVPDRNIAENWADRLIREHRTDPNELFALMLLTRRTDDRVLDVSDQTRQRVIGFMQRFGASEHWIELVRQKTELIGQEEQTVFGDSLPLGLSLIDT